MVGPIADPGSADAEAFRAAASSPGCTVAGIDTECMPASGGQLCLIQVGADHVVREGGMGEDGRWQVEGEGHVAGGRWQVAGGGWQARATYQMGGSKGWVGHSRRLRPGVAGEGCFMGFHWE